MTLQYSLYHANLPMVEIVYLHLGYQRFIKPIIIAINTALYIIIKIRQVGLCLKRVVDYITNLIVYNLQQSASYLNNYNSLLFLNYKLNILSSILSCVLIIYKAVLYLIGPITINLQLLNIYIPSIPCPLLILYLPSMATQLNSIYTIKEAQYESTGKTFRKDEQFIFRLSISSTHLYKIKGTVKNIINKSNAISIHF